MNDILSGKQYILSLGALCGAVCIINSYSTLLN